MAEIYNKKHDVTVYRVNNDVCGNPRYVISWLSLGLENSEPTKQTREAGLSKYRGKSFGGGFVFQSYNLTASLDFISEKLGAFSHK